MKTLKVENIFCWSIFLPFYCLLQIWDFTLPSENIKKIINFNLEFINIPVLALATEMHILLCLKRIQNPRKNPRYFYPFSFSAAP